MIPRGDTVQISVPPFRRRAGYFFYEPFTYSDGLLTLVSGGRWKTRAAVGGADDSTVIQVSSGIAELTGTGQRFAALATTPTNYDLDAYQIEFDYSIQVADANPGGDWQVALQPEFSDATTTPWVAGSVTGIRITAADATHYNVRLFNGGSVGGTIQTFAGPPIDISGRLVITGGAATITVGVVSGFGDGTADLLRARVPPATTNIGFRLMRMSANDSATIDRILGQSL